MISLPAALCTMAPTSYTTNRVSVSTCFQSDEKLATKICFKSQWKVVSRRIMKARKKIKILLLFQLCYVCMVSK